MAKHKKNQEANNPQVDPENENVVEQSTDIAGVEPGETPAQSPVLGKPQNEKEARELVKAKYKVPPGTKLVLVTSDGNVFYKNQSSAVDHAVKNDLKLFRLAWD